MDVSVVIPSYNSKKFLKQTLESANKQEFEGKFEILVIDDCSTDGSFEFAQSLAEKYSNIKVYQTPTNGGGPAWARNLGVKKANGKYVSFLDADDLWHPNKIQKQFELAEKSGCQFISTKKYIFPENSIFSFPDIKRPAPSPLRISYKDMKIKNRISTSSSFITRELALKYPFKEDSSYTAVEDFDCWLRVHREIDHSLKIQERLLAYRVVGTSISRNKWKMQLKVLNLLKNHDTGSGKLGWKAYFYLSSHILISIKQRLLSNA